MNRAALFLLSALALPALAAPRPKLIVLIVGEQFRSDYLDRYRPSFSAGGFNRLLKGGAVFRQCRYQYLATFPASGAAVLATGAYPEHNGIVAEHWYDRYSKTVVGAADDRDYGLSPRNLATTTLMDQLRRATAGRSRTVSISLRPQTAVLLGGWQPLGCYWFDDSAQFVSSPYYVEHVPAWVTAFQNAHPALRFRGQPWKAVDSKDSAPPLRLIDAKGANGVQDFFASYRASPFAVDEQFEFASAAVEAEQLGAGAAPDVLAISLSSLYLLGLEVGADSPLMRDMILRLDRKLETFLAWLDSKLGAERTWTIFTATQGLSATPESLQEDGIVAGRVAGQELAAAVNEQLSTHFGRASYVEKYVFPSLYLRREAVQALAAIDLRRAAGEAALTVPGVAGYFTVTRASTFLSPESAAPLARSIFPGRSGDLVIAYQPYFSERFGEDRGVSPGSFYNYDTLVPLILYGPAFRAQTFEREVSPIDLAGTLATALDIPPPPSATGRPLLEALKEK